MSGTAFPFPCSTHVKLSSNKEDLASPRCTQESWGEGKPTSASVCRLMQALLLCKLLHCKGQGTPWPGRTPIRRPQEATQQTPEHEPTTRRNPTDHTSQKFTKLPCLAGACPCLSFSFCSYLPETEILWKMSYLLSSVCHLQRLGSELGHVSSEILSESALEWIWSTKKRCFTISHCFIGQD